MPHLGRVRLVGNHPITLELSACRDGLGSWPTKKEKEAAGPMVELCSKKDIIGSQRDAIWFPSRERIDAPSSIKRVSFVTFHSWASLILCSFRFTLPSLDFTLVNCSGPLSCRKIWAASAWPMSISMATARLDWLKRTRSSKLAAALRNLVAEALIGTKWASCSRANSAPLSRKMLAA